MDTGIVKKVKVSDKKIVIKCEKETITLKATKKWEKSNCRFDNYYLMEEDLIGQKIISIKGENKECCTCHDGTNKSEDINIETEEFIYTIQFRGDHSNTYWNYYHDYGVGINGKVKNVEMEDYIFSSQNEKLKAKYDEYVKENNEKKVSKIVIKGKHQDIIITAKSQKDKGFCWFEDVNEIESKLLEERIISIEEFKYKFDAFENSKYGTIYINTIYGNDEFRYDITFYGEVLDGEDINSIKWKVKVVDKDE